MSKDIVDDIDRLVDESLSRPIVDDYSRNRYDKCGHCNRDWHGIPLTQKIAEMYKHGTFDETYRVDTDDSEIICHGSDFIGPMKSPGIGGAANWVESIVTQHSDTRADDRQPTLEELRADGWVDMGAIVDDGLTITFHVGHRHVHVGHRVNSSGAAS